MAIQLEKTYEPKQYESAIYQRWEDSGAFQPKGEGEPFAIIMPPPNANGELHVGHAVGYTLTDVIIRYQRMQGKKTLWLPGTDHAGIETQFVFERDVLAKQGKSRFDLGPQKFYEQLMEFSRAKQGNIISQFRSMGFSADWSKLKFTLDQDIIDIVYDTFKKMHDDGLVYRGNRLVNWCPRCNAAFADIELLHQDQEDTMYTLDYGPIQIATVRPETIFGDVAVAVNPKDSRYQNLVGQEATLPLAERQLPIIADEHVEPEAGTGALKVTPAHDATDYEIGKTHKLPEISVIDPAGNLINVPEEFAGLSIKDGRQKVVEALRLAGKVVDEETIKHAVAVHDRCGTVIEPLISEQWFLRIKPLNKATIEAFQNDKVRTFPARFKKIALNWLANEHDWCISRQIWWGIRIPVYYKTSQDPDKETYLIAADEQAAIDYYGPGNYRPESDTFDTWFSSGQWPFATLTTTGDFDAFYPTALMGTAREILHKWVTRMVMFSLYKTGQVPFKDVYLWGLVTDESGQKMSKSKGNVLDPLAMTAKYGTDAVRLAGAISNTPGNDSPLGEHKFAAYRNFNNKLWNVARFVLAKLPDDFKPTAPQPASLADEWLLERLHQATNTITQKLDQYRLNEAAETVYHLLWDDFADWYIEASKVNPNPQLMAYGLETILKLAHPFVPFVTEAIWQKIPSRSQDLITTSWPSPPDFDAKAAADFSQLMALVTEARTLQAELELGPVALYYQDSPLLSDNAELVTKLAGLLEVSQVKEGSGLPLSGSRIEAWLAADVTSIDQYRQKLLKRQQATQDYQARLTKQLANKGFTGAAPKAVVEQTRISLADAEAQLKRFEQQLNSLQQ